MFHKRAYKILFLNVVFLFLTDGLSYILAGAAGIVAKSLTSGLTGVEGRRLFAHTLHWG